MCAQSPVRVDSTPTLLLPSRVFDGTDIHDGWAVLVRGDRIAAAGPASAIATPTGTRRVDLAGATLMPGMIEGHSHLLLHPYNETPWDNQVLREPLALIDILVNNAANYETVEFEKLTVRQWDAIFASNSRAPFLVSREALKWMRRPRGKGTGKIEAKIIHMGSLGGLRPWATHAHYCSSKAALHMLTKVMAKALAPEIAVNAVAPGMIDLGEKAAAAFMRRMAKETPMRRNGRDEEVAAAVLFFASAPQFITGQVLAVDGGLGL